MQISVRGFAEVSNAKEGRKKAVLKRFKNKESGESTGRSNYYVKALKVIRHHHRHEHELRDQALADLQSDSLSAADSRARAKALNNLNAASTYIKVFGHRKFSIRKGNRLYFHHKDLVVSSQPDLIVEEDGALKLIKLHCAQKKLTGLEVMSIIQLIHMAADQQGMPLQPAQVECMEIYEESTTVGASGKFQSFGTIQAACEEIISIWNTA